MFACTFVCLFWFWSLVVNSYGALGSASLFPSLSPVAAEPLMVPFIRLPHSRSQRIPYHSVLLMVLFMVLFPHSYVWSV